MKKYEILATTVLLLLSITSATTSYQGAKDRPHIMDDNTVPNKTDMDENSNILFRLEAPLDLD